MSVMLRALSIESVSLCRYYTCRFLEDNKVPAVVAFDQVNCGAHATDASADDDDRRIAVVDVANRHFWVWFVACHIGRLL